MVHIVKVFLQCLTNLVRDLNWRKNKSGYFASYCRYVVKYIVCWKLLRIPLNTEKLLQYRLRFFHYSIFLSLFEDMFLKDEYYVNLPKNPYIIDLGSEVGLSVAYFKSLYPNAKIIAFEPDPASYKLLVKNIKDNAMKKVTSYNVALANKIGSSSFYIDPLVDGSLTMSLSAQRQQKKIIIKVARLSRYIKQKVDLLKMDIEGAEFDVLSDLSHSKKISLIDTMIIEYHHHIDSKKNNLSRLLALLEKNGFGYQLKAKYALPFKKRIYQDFLIFAYKE